MCDEAVDAFRPFVPDWFVTSKMIKKLIDDLFFNDAIDFMNEYSNYFTFLVMKWLFSVKTIIISTLIC